MNSKCSKNNLLKSIFVSFMLIVLGAICSLSFFGVNTQVVNADGGAALEGYLDRNWFTKTGLASKSTITEIYFQNDAPQTFTSFASVATKDENGTEYDGTTADVVAYLDGEQNIKVYIASAQKIYAPASCYELFKDFTALTKIEFNNFDTSKTLSMQSMFSGCDALETLDLSNLNTNSVTNMSEMFVGCDNLKTINLENINTSSVQKMMGMFYNCVNLTSLDLSGFDTAMVQSFATVDKGSWTVDIGMFQGCSSLEQITLSENFKIEKANSLNNMFYGCSSLQVLDLSSFDCTNITSATDMLKDMSKLYRIVLPYNVGDSLTIDLPRTFYDIANPENEFTQISMVVDSPSATNLVTLQAGFSITYDLGGGVINGTNINEYRISDQEQIFALLPPSLDGRAFLGWRVENLMYKNSLIKVENGSLAIPQNDYGDIKLTAVYAEPSYQIILDSDGGNSFVNMTFDFSASNQEITLPTPEKTDYIFVEWKITVNTTPESTVDDLKLKIPANAYGNVTLKAEYRQAVYHTISFDTDGGIELAPLKYAVMETDQIITLPKGARDGYEFLHWELFEGPLGVTIEEGGSIKIPANTTGEITLQAKYVDQVFKIIFDVDGGEPLDDMQYIKMNGTYEEYLQTPVKMGFVFDTWKILINCLPAASLTENVLFIPENASGNITLKATWIKVSVVTFDVNPFDQFGMELNKVPEVEYEESLAFVGLPYEELPTLEVEGYTFEGWYLDKEFTKKVTAETVVEQTEDYTLYARWTRPIKEVTTMQLFIIIAILIVALAIIVVTYVLIYKK